MSAQTDDTAAKDVALEVTSHNGGAADAAGDGSPHEAVLAPRDGHAGDDSPHEAEPAPMAHEDDYDLGTAWGAPDTRTWQRKMVDNLPSLPFLSWLPKYQKSFLKGDVTSCVPAPPWPGRARWREVAARPLQQGRPFAPFPGRA